MTKKELKKTCENLRREVLFWKSIAQCFLAVSSELEKRLRKEKNEREEGEQAQGSGESPEARDRRAEE